MTSIEVKKRILDELTEFESLADVLGFDLNLNLIEPRKEIYLSSFDPQITLVFWTVFEETSDRSGYKITFDEDDDSFGIGILTKNDQLMDIGTYGDFLDALKGL